jgi:DivIVA domain-containing protein
MARKKDEQGAGGPQRLTPVDIQQIQFRRAFRGYDEQEVDDFLDRITEEFTALIDERRSLSERAGSLPTIPVSGAGDVAAASRQAEQIVRRARDEAAAIVRAAQSRTSARDPQGRPVGGPGIAGFVTKERAFLQELARLVQDHAQSVKDMVQAARPEPATATAPAPRAAGPPQTPPSRTAAAQAAPAEADRDTGLERGGGAEAEVLRVPEAAAGGAGATPAGAEGIRAEAAASDESAAPTRGDTRRGSDADTPRAKEQPLAAVPRAGDADADAAGPDAGGQESSLRELFWGED